MSTGASHFMTVRVPVELADAIRRLAEREDRSISAEIRRALREHVERDVAKQIDGIHATWGETPR